MAGAGAWEWMAGPFGFRDPVRWGVWAGPPALRGGTRAVRGQGRGLVPMGLPRVARLEPALLLVGRWPAGGEWAGWEPF